MRVQCKTAVLSGSVLKVPCYSNRRGREGFIKRFYDAAEVDAIAAYSPDLDRCYFLPLAEIPGRSYVQLRLQPCGNNQRERINWAANFLLEARLAALLGP